MPSAGWIAIARHGEPALDRTQKIDWRAYQDWWRAYDAGGLKGGQAVPEELRRLGAEADVLFASPLRRAVETAAAVCPDRAPILDPVFVEAPLPPPPIPGLRRPGAWGVWARSAWWLGRAGGEESRSAAELRAEAAVARLAASALRGENVLLCAHGWFNRMLRPVLLRQGWTCVDDGGDAYWSHRRYVKRR